MTDRESKKRENWEKRGYPKILKTLSPRLQRDVEQYTPTLPPDGSYYIYGPTGTGKTTLAAHMYIRAWRDKHMQKTPGSIVWTSVHTMMSAIRRTMDAPRPHDEDFKDEFAVMAEYQVAAQLFLDDIGDYKFTDWSISQLHLLIDYRYENLLPIVITSNLSLDELTEALGDSRIPSRINRMCKLKKVT